MICYFSGTGNSQRAARQIAQHYGDTVFSINKSLPSGDGETLHSDEPFSGKGFAAGGGCVGCGLCAERCPLCNITIENQKPHWNGNCTHCMACISGCPAGAIEYMQKYKGRSHYYIMEDEG